LHFSLYDNISGKYVRKCGKNSHIRQNPGILAYESRKMLLEKRERSRKGVKIELLKKQCDAHSHSRRRENGKPFTREERKLREE
jgi:hypothetical protein